MSNGSPRLDERELSRRRRWRSIAIGLVLAGLALLFYLLTIVKMTGPSGGA